MTDSTKGLLQAYSAIFLGAIIGFSGVKIIEDTIDKHVLKTCHPTKITMIHSVFGGHLFCSK